MGEQKQKCPICSKEVEDYAEVRTDTIFCATDVFEGLRAWSMYSTEKEVLCHAGNFVHLRFPDGGERLVKMTGRIDLEKIAALHEAQANRDEVCETCGEKPGSPFYIGQYDESPDGYYCDECAADQGFCYGCHIFWAGWESFDFSPVKGLCESCLEQLRAETGDYDDTDQTDYEYDFDYEE